MLFGDAGDDRIPNWVLGLAALVTLVLIPVTSVLTKWYTDRLERKRKEAEIANQSTEHTSLTNTRRERNVISQMERLLETINEERGRDIARWTSEREELNRKIQAIEQEADECRIKAARQEERIDWLTGERTRQQDEIQQLKKRLGDLSHSMGDQKGEPRK